MRHLHEDKKPGKMLYWTRSMELSKVTLTGKDSIS